MMTIRALSGLILPLIVAGFSVSLLIAEDARLQGRFGVTRSEPIYAGYLFVDGRYVDAPYVIEQRGVDLFVNGHQCRRLVPGQRFPGPYDTPLYEDPGMPDDIDENTSITGALDHPVSRKKSQYWRTLELSGDDYRQRFIDYYNSLPNIVEVVPSEAFFPGRYAVTLRHHDGSAYAIQLTGKDMLARLPVKHGSKQLMIGALSEWRRSISEFSSQRMLIVCSKRGSQWKNEPAVGWAAVMAVMEGDLTAAEKIEQLHRLEFVSKGELADAADKFNALLTDFKATEQLRRRLAGGDNWVDAARESTESLPSGLVQVPDFVNMDVPLPPPPPDKLGENRLGWRRSEPIVSGYLFVDGQYIDPPYVVEQRGYGIFINGYLCENAPHQALIFANFPEAAIEDVEPDQRKTWFGEPLLLEDQESGQRLLERLLKLHDWVSSYLEADGFVVVENHRLRALHNKRWQSTWNSGLHYFVPYDPPLEQRADKTILAKGRIKEMGGMFLPVNVIRGGEVLESDINAAMERYGSFVLNCPNLTPGFWKRLAGGSVWEQFLHDTMPPGPFGVVQEPNIP